MGYGFSPLGYCIQFLPYAGKETSLDEYGDIGIWLGGAVIAHLASIINYRRLSIS